jgi:hypothetical protein
MFEERIFLGNGFSMRILFRHGGRYRLALRRQKNLLVEYKGEGKKHIKSLRGRESAYAFRSVEQLRYDFERDAEDAQRQG